MRNRLARAALGGIGHSHGMLASSGCAGRRLLALVRGFRCSSLRGFRYFAPEWSEKRGATPPDEKLNLLEREAWAQTPRLAQRRDCLFLAAKAGRGER